MKEKTIKKVCVFNSGCVGEKKMVFDHDCDVPKQIKIHDVFNYLVPVPKKKFNMSNANVSHYGVTKEYRLEREKRVEEPCGNCATIYYYYY